MISEHPLSRRLILRVALLGEALLAAAAYLIALTAGVPLSVGNGTGLLLRGAVGTVPMLIVNLAIFAYLSRPGSPYHIYHRFKITVVRPLCLALDPLSALLVAIASGVGEELFFRGALLGVFEHWFGVIPAVIASSALFALAHFVGMVREFASLILLYFLCGVYLAFLTLESGDLLPAMIAHALYNFVAILYLKYLDPRSAVNDHSSP